MPSLGLASWLLLAVELIPGLLGSPAIAEAQSGLRIPRIGFPGSASAQGYASQIEAFRKGLARGDDFIQ